MSAHFHDDNTEAEKQPRLARAIFADVMVRSPCMRPDESVVQCVIGAYCMLRFPKPDRGVVTVYFPLIFNPSD